MTATVTKFPIKARLECSECGAAGEGTCGCGAPYVPPSQRASEEAANNPRQSVRALAEKTGVGRGTAERALTKARATVPVGTVAGLDGKERRMPRRPQPSEPWQNPCEPTATESEESTVVESTPQQKSAAFFLRADAAHDLAENYPYAGRVTQQHVDVASATAEAWSLLARSLQERLDGKSKGKSKSKGSSKANGKVATQDP